MFGKVASASAETDKCSGKPEAAAGGRRQTLVSREGTADGGTLAQDAAKQAKLLFLICTLQDVSERLKSAPFFSVRKHKSFSRLQHVWPLSSLHGDSGEKQRLVQTHVEMSIDLEDGVEGRRRGGDGDFCG